MSTRHRPSMRTLVAMLLALALLLMLVAPYVDAADTIALSGDVALASQTLDGTVLDASAAASATATVNVLLQQCTVQGAGVTVSGATTSNAAGSTAITLRILGTTVKDATLAFRNYIPAGSLVHIVNVTATMEGTTPLFDVQNFYLGRYSSGYYGSSMKIQHVRAMWGIGDGGSVVQVGGSTRFFTMSGQIFSLSETVVTGAAHVLEITSECTGTHCLLVDGGLNAFDLIEFRDARGAFIYSNSTAITLGNSHHGMTRFSNITMTGGQPFFEVRNGTLTAVDNYDYSSVVFSAISNDGPLFALGPGANITASSPKAKYSFRHINVASVMSGANSYTANVPYGYDATKGETWYWYMGNITVAGKLMKTIDELEKNRLYATQLVGAYGEVIEVRHGSNYPQLTLGDAAAVNCVSDADITADFVELVPGVNRAECECLSNYNNAPYCTTAVDPLVYYDAYSPSPATCGVVNCDACLFGQTSQCGACSTGYQLTASLGCDRIPCNVGNCNECTADNVCGACAESYVLTSTSTCAKCTVSHCSQCVSPGDGTQCAACSDGFTLSAEKTTCYTCGIPNCNGCTGDGVCGACAESYVLTSTNTCAKCTVLHCSQCVSPGDGTQCDSCAVDYTLSDDKSTCIPCGLSNCNECTADNVCGACAESYVLTSTNTCAKCTVSHCSQCVSPGDGTQCAACSDGFTLSAEKTTCYTCGIPNCNGCTADGVCGSCEKGYKLKGTSECKKNGIGWWVWLIVGIVAAAVVAGIIVLVVCCVRRRRSKAEESSSSVRAGSNNAMRRDNLDASEMQQYGSVTSAGAAPPNRSAPSGAYQWHFDDFNARCSTQGSQATSTNPFDYYNP